MHKLESQLHVPPGTSRLSGESLRRCAGVDLLAYYRAGDAGRPLVLFVPGGAHLARAAYGHPGACPEDFLDRALEGHGMGLLAASYPSSHPLLGEPRPELDQASWAAALAELAAEHLLRQKPPAPLLICGWSMAGATVGPLASALQARGVRPLGFVSLSATPPPWSVAQPPALEPVNAAGFWDVEPSARRSIWLEELRLIGVQQGRTVMSPQTYRQHYACDTPQGLRGFPPAEPWDLAALPLCGVVAPTRSQDARHALVDAQQWGALTTLGLTARIERYGVGNLSPKAWRAMRSLVTGAPRQLARTIDGGHFFFLGRRGARASAQHLADLAIAMVKIERVFEELTSSKPS